MQIPASFAEQRLAFSVPEFAQAVGVCRATLYALCKQGKGPRLSKIGRRTVIRLSDALEWLASLEPSPANNIPNSES